MQRPPSPPTGTILTSLSAAIILVVWAMSSALAGPLESGDSPPHIVVLLADDLGWRDVSFHGSEIRTPNIDRLARDGRELDRFYVQPTCSPTRTALMTGKSPIRLGITLPISKNEPGGLPLSEKLLPEYLAEVGYQPMMVGKWHLGHSTPDRFPQARGFESFYGNLTGGIGYWDHNHGGGHDFQRDGVTIREEGYVTELVANEALRRIRERDPARPMFLYVAFNAPHLPNEAPAEALARYDSILDQNRRTHAAMVSELDFAIGRILAELEATGMLENTLVFFSSDNGGLIPGAGPPAALHAARFLTTIFDRPLPIEILEFFVANVQDGGSDNDPLPKYKASIAEGGSRVPAAIWWPGRIEGGTHTGFTTMSDLLPTLLEAIGASERIPDDLDGMSQWAALNGDPAGSETPDYVTAGMDGVAIYRAPWKLHATDPPQLYDIYADPAEERDLAEAHPERVAALTRTLDEWPRGDSVEATPLEILLDPDFFGGPEDREPWADVARDRVSGDD